MREKDIRNGFCLKRAWPIRKKEGKEKGSAGRKVTYKAKGDGNRISRLSAVYRDTFS